MFNNLRLLMAAMAMAAVLGGFVHAGSFTGLGDGTSFEDPNNWSDPNEAFPGSTRDINGAFTVDRNVSVNTNRTFIKGGAVLNIASGTHNDGQSGANIFNFLGDTSSGTVNQSGGHYLIGHGLRVGVGNANADGTYNLTDGHLEIFRGSNSKIEPSNPGGRPSMEIGDAAAAGQAGLFEISGGYLETRAGVHIAPNGVFSVVGSDPNAIDIGPQGSGDGSWIQHGTLKAAIDAGGITPIFVDDFDNAGGVVGILRTGSLLDLSFDSISPFAGTWTLLEIENTDITDEGLALSGSTAPGWSFNIDNSGANGLLTATYVIPEPASLALIVLGCLASVCGRRRD